jgi:plasmid stability protein
MTRGVRYNVNMTITIEHLPEPLSRALEARARSEGKSVPDVAKEILAHSLNSSDEPVRRDLTDIVGSMSEEDARAIEETVRWLDAGDLANQS